MKIKIEDILIFVYMILLLVCVYYIVTSYKWVFRPIPYVKVVSSDKIVKVFDEIYLPRSEVYDTYYIVYTYDTTIKYLNKACSKAWDFIEYNNVELAPNKFDCEDISMLILSLTRIYLNNVPCFLYNMWNGKNGHVMIACVVYDNDKLKKIYYDVNCVERKGFKVPKGYYSYIIG